MKSLENLFLGFFPVFAAVTACHLFSHSHKGIQIGYRLGHQSDLRTSECLLLLLVKTLSPVYDLSRNRCVLRQDSHHGMCQQAFSGTAGAGDGYNLPRFHIQAQVRYYLQVILLQSPVIHMERYG